MLVQTAVEEALLPLRMAGLGIVPDHPALALQKVDDALAEVHARGYTKKSIRLYVKSNIFLCFGNGTWHPTQGALVAYIKANKAQARVHRALVKQFSFAKMFLVKLTDTDGGKARQATGISRRLHAA